MNRVFRLAHILMRFTAADQKRVDYAHSQFPEIPIETINDIDNKIPGNSKYLVWVVKQISDKKLQWPDSSRRIQQALTFFVEKTKKPSEAAHLNLQRDVNRYDLNTLENKIEEIKLQKEQEELRKKYNLDLGTSLVYNSDPFKIIKIDPKKIDMEYAVASAVHYSQETHWCTKNSENAKEYLALGPLYVVFKNNVKYVLIDHIASQIKNIQDEDFDFSKDREFLELLINSTFLNYTAIVSLKLFYSPTNLNERDLKNIMVFPKFAYFYANDVIKNRWVEAEPYIAKKPILAYKYAKNVIHGRFIEAESFIALNIECAYKYAKNIIKGRFIEAEPEIIKYYYYSAEYAKHVLHQRWFEAEPTIEKNFYVWNDYKRFFGF